MKGLVAIFAVMCLCSGCATMIRGTEEMVQVTSEPSGAIAEASDGQKCVTPCQLKFKRNQTVQIKITKDGYQPQSMSVYPTLAGAGVLLGGVIDYGTGAVYSLTPNPCCALLNPDPNQRAQLQP